MRVEAIATQIWLYKVKKFNNASDKVALMIFSVVGKALILI